MRIKRYGDCVTGEIGVLGEVYFLLRFVADQVSMLVGDKVLVSQ